MGDIVLAGATSGTITLQPTAVAGSSTLTLPAANATVLTSASPASNLPSSINGPAFSAYAASSQTISASTFTKVTFGTEVFDTNNNFASSTFTPTVAGYYQINAVLRTETTSGGITNGIVAIYKNGSSYRRGAENNSSLGNNQLVVSDIVYCNGTTDYIEIYGYIDAAGTVSFNYNSVPITSSFSGCLVRSA